MAGEVNDSVFLPVVPGTPRHYLSGVCLVACRAATRPRKAQGHGLDLNLVLALDLVLMQQGHGLDLTLALALVLAPALALVLTPASDLALVCDTPAAAPAPFAHT